MAVSAVLRDDSNATYVFSSPIFGKNSMNQIAQNVAAVYTQSAVIAHMHC